MKDCTYEKYALTIAIFPLKLVYRSAKFDTKFINFFARLFILFTVHRCTKLFGQKVK